MVKSNDFLSNPSFLKRSVFTLTYIFFLISIFSSFNLWFDYDREIPFISYFNLPFLNWINYSLSIILTTLLIFNIAKPTVVSLLSSSLTILSLFLIDSFKCQPWVYFYLFIIAIHLITIRFKHISPFLILKFLLGTMYFWAGVHKLSSQFLSSMSFIFKSDFIFLKSIFSLFPYFEILFGLSIIFFFKKKLPVLVAIGFHFGIILFIYLSNSNFIIIAWNIYFFLLWILLFYAIPFTKFNSLINFYFPIILSFFCLMPILNFYGNYNHYFSFSLYSGKIPLFFMVFPNDAHNNSLNTFNNAFVSNEVATAVLKTEQDEKVVSYYKYCIDELNVPPVIDNRIINRLKTHYSNDFKEVYFFVFRY